MSFNPGGLGFSLQTLTLQPHCSEPALSSAQGPHPPRLGRWAAGGGHADRGPRAPQAEGSTRRQGGSFRKHRACSGSQGGEWALILLERTRGDTNEQVLPANVPLESMSLPGLLSTGPQGPGPRRALGGFAHCVDNTPGGDGARRLHADRAPAWLQRPPPDTLGRAEDAGLALTPPDRSGSLARLGSPDGGGDALCLPQNLRDPLPSSMSLCAPRTW